MTRLCAAPTAGRRRQAPLRSSGRQHTWIFSYLSAGPILARQAKFRMLSRFRRHTNVRFSETCSSVLMRKKKVKILPDFARTCIEFYLMQIKSFRVQNVNTIRTRKISEHPDRSRNFLEWPSNAPDRRRVAGNGQRDIVLLSVPERANLLSGDCETCFCILP